jgi:RNA polymerase sigma-70 factor (ECF subfamily)
MISLSRTTTALLEGLLRGEDERLWDEFSTRYRPIVIAFSRRMGLGDADAEDVAQETLVQFLQAYRAGKYDRTRGRLRSWIVGIAKYRVADVQRRGAETPAGSCVAALADREDENRLSEIWDAEHRREVLRQALLRVRQVSRLDPQTVDVFERMALRDEPPAEVAAALGLTLNDVYVAKHRATSRLREIIREIEAEYDDSLG